MFLKLTSRIANKQTEQAKGKLNQLFKGKPKPVLELPWDLKDGAKVTIDKTKFILGGDYLFMEYPGKKHLVQAFDYYQMAGEKFFLMHLKEMAGENLSVLEISPGDPNHRRLWMTAWEINPSPEEWDDWIGPNGMIGQESFPAGESDDMPTYWRMWNKDGPERIPPWILNVYMHENAFDKTPDKVQMQAMLYGRIVENDKGHEMEEFCMPIHIKEPDGSEYIQINIGIGLDATSAKF